MYVALCSHRILSQLLSHLILLCSFSGGVIIGYVHNLSEIRTSRQNNVYFDMSLQTQDKPEKHQQCKTMCELSSPIKLTKYNLTKKNHLLTRTKFTSTNRRDCLNQPATRSVLIYNNSNQSNKKIA